MEILAYPSPLPPQRKVPGSFVDRNPNLCYLLVSGKQSVMIDACSNIDDVHRELTRRGLRLDRLLLTHYHPDHTFALADWLRLFPGLSIGVHVSSLGAVMAATGVAKEQVIPLTEDALIAVGEESIRVIAAPGHTSDSLCFWDEKGQNLFTGDVIFGGHIGCTDYGRGGNRNIFYRTIVKLLKMLPPAASIFPGHLSEYYKTLPPYELSREKTGNPYLANVLSGKKGNFDRALKYFSLDFETAESVMLGESHLDEICRLEREIWIPELQASRQVIRERLRQGHRMLAVKEADGFTGMVSWCYSPFALEDDPECFPRNFQEFSNCKSCRPENSRSAFIYNVGVRPDRRRQGAGSLLLQEAFDKIRKDGIYQVFIDSRMASYNGSAGHLQENVAPNELFRAAVDRYFSHSRMPDAPVLASDPTVNFYMKNGLTPWIIRQDFIPDVPSGNMRVICQTNLDQDPPLTVAPA